MRLPIVVDHLVLMTQLHRLLSSTSIPNDESFLQKREQTVMRLLTEVEDVESSEILQNGSALSFLLRSKSIRFHEQVHLAQIYLVR